MKMSDLREVSASCLLAQQRAQRLRGEQRVNYWASSQPAGLFWDWATYPNCDRVIPLTQSSQLKSFEFTRDEIIVERECDCISLGF